MPKSGRRQSQRTIVQNEVTVSGSTTVTGTVGLDNVCVASSTNNTTSNLSGGATYTGTGELNAYPDVMVTCKADVAGTLYFEFSDTGSFAGEHSIFPVAGFTVEASIYEFHVAVKGYRYFRVRYLNGSSAQSSFRLNTYYGIFAKSTNAPLNQSVALDADSAVSRTMDPVLEISRGAFSEILYVNKFGHNNDVDTATDPEDLWLNGGLWVPPTQARTMVITSSSANDTSAGTGARTILISGLDSNWEIASETITMNGTSNVNSASTYRRINRMQVVTAGSSQVNEGTITCTAQTDATVQATISLGTVGYGQSLLGIYTIPAGYTGYLTNWHIDFYQTTATATATIGLFVRRSVDTATPALNLKDIAQLVVGGTSTDERRYTPYLQIDAKSDVLIRIIEVSANNSSFTGGFDIILVKN